MRLLWTLLKVAIALCLVIPISIIVLATALGLFAALLGLAILTLKVAVVGLIAWGVFRLVATLLGGSTPGARTADVRQLPAVDPHYEAAMRELDRDLGHSSR